MEQNGIHELTAAYALNALSETEAAEYQAHLGRCPDCRRELSSFQETVASLAYAADAPAPPLVLRSRILAQARGERPSVVSLRPRWAVPALAAAAAVAASLAIGLGIWGSSLSSSLDEERDARAAQERALAVLARPDARRIALEGADGTLLVAATGEAALLVSDLSPAPEDKTYEAWVVENGRPRAAGLFDAQGERTVVALSRPVPDDAVVAVTIEDDGGATEPSGTVLFSAEPT
jgi:anti-sigma-K factor RskA